jgi:hypothetical protein
LKLRRTLALCLASSLALAACGSRELGDTAEIRQVVRTAVLVHEPAECTELATEAFLEQISGQTGEAAVRACEGEAEDPIRRAKAVAVSNVKVRGSAATAEVAVAGHSGRSLVTLVEEGGRWKLDEVRSQGAGKQRRLRASKRLVQLTGPKELECIERRIAETSQAENDEINAAGPFSSARADAQTRGCLDFETETVGAGHEVAPKGSHYSYRIPPGFRKLDLSGLDASTTVITSTRTTHSGASISVGEEKVPALLQFYDVGELEAEVSSFEDALGEKYDGTGSSSSPVVVSTIAGHPAIRWEVTGGTGQVSQGTDEERIHISLGDRRVVVGCAWGRTEAEERTIKRGCQTLLRSLRVP